MKTAPINKFIRNDMKRRGIQKAINCMGIRAEESPARARKKPINRNHRLSKAGRTVIDLYPVFIHSTEYVFDWIEMNEQHPHKAYEQNERLSCMFCIMGSKNDLLHAKEKNPTLFEQYVELEKEVGHTMFYRKGQPIPLMEVVS